MTNSSEIRRQVAKLRSITVPSEFGKIPASVPYLDGLLKQASALNEKHLLFALLVEECGRTSNRPLELHYLQQQAKSLPLQPVLLTRLATALAYTPGMNIEALSVSHEAVALAKKENRQVRWSLTSQARIALMLDDYDTLTHALEDLVADADAGRSEDTGYEFDFVDQIDIRRFDARLLGRYKKLANKPT